MKIDTLQIFSRKIIPPPLPPTDALSQNTIILRRPGAAIFANIIKIITRFIKQIFKDPRKAKRIRNCVLKCNLYLYFLIQQNFLISIEKMLMAAKVRGYVT